MRRLAIVLAVTLPLPAQGLPWDIPHRGALIYQRETTASDFDVGQSRLRPEWFVRRGDDGGHEWRYLACARGRVPAGVEQPTFADQDWLLGKTGFGTDVGKNATQRSPWTTHELVLRTRIDLGRKKPKLAMFLVDHDDGLRIWWNGRLVVGDDGFGRNRSYVLAGDTLDAWQRGDNLLVVQCSQVGGAQYLDLGLCFFHTLPAGVKDGPGLQKAIADERGAADKIRGELFGGFRPPPLLLQGELGKDQDQVRLPPGDLRELAWWAATDLSKGATGGTMNRTATRLLRLGDLQVKGKVAAIDTEGWQTLELTVKSQDLDLLDDSKRFVDRWIRPYVWYGFDGRLDIRRRVEVRGDKARVAEFTSRLRGTFLRGKDGKEPVGTIGHDETWRLHAVRDGQDAAFRSDVAKALERGCARLREQLADPNGHLLNAQPADGGDSYHSGRLAIGLLALVKGGVPKTDEVVQRCLQALRTRKLIDTYSLGNALMAMEAMYSPSAEFGDLKSGAIDRPRKRTVPAEDLALMQRWTDQLLQNIDTRVDPAYLLRFNYTRGGRYDHSVNQYGLLGLFSAHLCGVTISPQVWEAAANHLIADQGQGTSKVDLELTDYRAFARQQADPGGTRTVIRQPIRAAGWWYHEPKSEGEATPRYGSMTCAGITGLAICQAALLDHPNVKRPRLQGEASAARNAGFAWLAEHMTPRYHAGDIDRQQRWIYYYLYGLERAALLSGIALIQDRDWYFEGAMVLLGTQNDDGNWQAELDWDQAVERNAMAILFLKQSTLPVLTGQ